MQPEPVACALNQSWHMQPEASAEPLLGSECGRLLEALQLELGRLCTQNQALTAQNRKLSAALSDTASEPEGCHLVVPKAQSFRASHGSGLEEGVNGVPPLVDRTVSNRRSHERRVKLRYTCTPEEIVEYPAHFDTENMEKSVDLGMKAYSTVSSQGQTEVYRAKAEFFAEFRQICRDGKRMVTAEQLFDMRCAQEPWVVKMKATVVQEYKEALRAINDEIDSRRPGENVDSKYLDQMQRETYAALFQDRDYILCFGLSESNTAALSQITQVIIRHILTRDIALITDIEQGDLHAEQDTPRGEIFINILDVVAGILILLNVVTLTCSLDYAWPHWEKIETTFTFLFMSEVCLRIGIAGPEEHFMGPDRMWNIFDIAVVIVGLSDLVMQSANKGSEATNGTAIRMLRLLRMAKMVRVLRLKAFKELRLIVSGLIGGLRTIFWAFVFLFVFILMLGITTKEFLAMEPQKMECADKPWKCNEVHDHLTKFREELFGSVPRCMFTIFRCFVAEGCTSMDGTPLMPLLWDQSGGSVCILYVMCFLFLSFGLFNLIMATIVESTMEAAKLDETRRSRQRQREHLVMAHAIQTLVTILCSDDDTWKTKLRRSSLSWEGIGRNGWWWNRRPQPDLQGLLSSRISTKRFHCMLDHPTIQVLLERLGIQMTDPHNYIEAFDANQDGVLSVAELVKGLLKLRGTVEKADVVATLMVARDMQRSLKQVETMLARQPRRFGSVGTGSMASSHRTDLR